MASTVANKKLGPQTFVVVEPVNAGAYAQLVEARPSATPPGVGVAAADSAVVMGVALYPAIPPGTSGAGSTWGGQPSFDLSVPTDEVAVADIGIFKLKAGAAINFGQDVKAGALGVVVPLGASSLALKVGRCVDPAGIASGAIGLIRLTLS